jgi:phosphatidylinositol-3-phosphatase
MRAKSKTGVAILTGALSFVGAANAIDLIQNGSFESIAGGTPQYGGITDGTAPGWNGVVSTLPYSGTVYFAGPAIPASESPGSYHSWRHQSAAGAYSSFSTPTADLSYVTNYALKQTVSLTNAVNGGDIDAGRGQYAFSAWLASYTLDPEQPYLDLRFFDASGNNQIGPDVIFDRTSTNSWIGNAGAAGVIPLPDALTNPPAASNHHWAKYLRRTIIPQGARKATVYITRSPNAALSGSPDTYVDLVKLDAYSVNPQTPVLETAIPANTDSGVDPNVVITVTLRDGTTAVNTNSLQFSFDGLFVSPVIQKSGSVTTIKYDPPGALAGNSTHNYLIVFSDNGASVTTRTNQFQFTIAPATPPVAAIFPPDHVVVIMDENRTYTEIIGNPNDAPYINSLLPFAANMTRSVAEQHPTDPNYLYFFSGANQGITDNSIPSNLPFTTPNLAAQVIAAGFTFVDYAEDLPFTGDLTPVVNGPDGTYYEEENVAGYWISTNVPPPSINNLPPTVLQPLTNWPSDFHQLPTIAFVHSVEQNDMHQGYWPTDSITIRNGDTWLKNHLDTYVKWAMTNNGLLILTFDESYTSLEDTNLYNHIPTLFVGPMVKPGNYFQNINHFNLLRTLEDIYHLPYAGGAATVTPITDIWLPPRLTTTLLGGGQVQITWLGAAILQSASQVAGPYNDVTNVSNPYVLTPVGARFYRLKSL